MERIDVYVKEEQYDEWKKIAEIKGKSLSEFMKEAVEGVLKQGSEEERFVKLETEIEAEHKDVNHELNMLWEATGKLDKALKKLNRGERLEQSDFAYTE